MLRLNTMCFQNMKNAGAEDASIASSSQSIFTFKLASQGGGLPLIYGGGSESLRVSFLGVLYGFRVLFFKLVNFFRV